MTITLNAHQEKALQRAIESGVIQSVDEFIDTAIEALPVGDAEFDREKAHAAVARIRDLRKGIRLDLEGMSLREFAHIGHRFR